METALSIGLGIGLSAACGFRVFVPLLVASLAASSGHLHLASGFEWIGTTPATVAFAVATALEIAAYYIPWLDNLLDALATPAAVVAGVVVSASVMTGLSPFLRWTLALIAGGGIAGLVQGTTVAARAASSAATGGLGNAVVSTAEAGGAVAASLLAIQWPLVFMALLAAVALLFARRARFRPSPLRGAAPR